MVVIGLTGSLGTGKSTVAGMFANFGAEVLDADAIAHQLIGPQGACTKSVVKIFGSSVLDGGNIDRRKLAGIVFHDPKKIKRLEGIIHPVVKKEISARLRKFERSNNVEVVILDVPLLFESRLDRLVDYTVVVKASRQNQIKRARRKFGMSRGEALRRIRNQMPLRDKIRRADIIIDNDGPLTKTKNQVIEIWQRIRQKKKKKN